jgi:hypothetical protein
MNTGMNDSKEKKRNFARGKNLNWSCLKSRGKRCCGSRKMKNLASSFLNSKRKKRDLFFCLFFLVLFFFFIQKTFFKKIFSVVIYFFLSCFGKFCSSSLSLILGKTMENNIFVFLKGKTHKKRRRKFNEKFTFVCMRE